MMLGNLVLLGHLTGDPVYEEQASRLADGFAGIVRDLTFRVQRISLRP